MGKYDRNEIIEGFKWEGGDTPVTNGILVWSEIFTHDCENGEKIAIILLDTQGIFDFESDIQECSTIFGLSILLSSVQCFNIMRDIQENDLEHLDLFAQYGQLATGNNKEKCFHTLLFILRDFPYPNYDYGWDENYIGKVLRETETQTKPKKQLRKRIKSYFEHIKAFLLPSPGRKVARGDAKIMSEIDAEFLEYVEVLVPALVAPENLIIKEINGSKVKAGDLMQYIQDLTNEFNSGRIPTPDTILDVCSIMSNHCNVFI